MEGERVVLSCYLLVRRNRSESGRTRYYPTFTACASVSPEIWIVQLLQHSSVVTVPRATARSRIGGAIVKYQTRLPRDYARPRDVSIRGYRAVKLLFSALNGREFGTTIRYADNIMRHTHLQTFRNAACHPWILIILGFICIPIYSVSPRRFDSETLRNIAGRYCIVPEIYRTLWTRS